MRGANSARGSRRETRSSHNNNNSNNSNVDHNIRRSSSTINNDSNNNNDPPSPPYRTRKQHSQHYQQQQPDHQPQQREYEPNQHYQQPTSSYQHQPSHQYHSQDRRDRSGQRDQGSYRERSGQRSGQYPDSSVNRDGIPGNLGSVKFTPGLSTRELPPIETRVDPSKKFTGRCRLFVGNLAHNTTEDKVRKLFEAFGEIGELFLGPKSSFAFVKMDTKQNAEAARDKLDCSLFEGRPLRVRVAAHAAAIRIKHLSPVVTNELLAYAFRYFGEIERAVVIVDDKGKSTGEGIVEYSRKQSAMFAIKKCQTECFLLTASMMPVVVEPYDQQDNEEGLPEKSVNKNSIEFKEQRDVGPRFAEQGTFEHSFAMKWKDLYNLEKQKRERLEKEIEEDRKVLQSQIEYSRLEHDALQLETKLQQLKDNRMKLQQMNEQSTSAAQQREEQRRQQDLLIRQQEEEILRRQHDQNYLYQQETILRSQANIVQGMMGGAEIEQTDVDQGIQQTSASQEIDPSMSGVAQTMNQGPRTFADAAMMGMSQQFMQAQQIPTQMGMQQAAQNQQAMYAGYIPPPPIQSNIGDSVGNSAYGSYQQAYIPPPPVVTTQAANTGGGQQKMTRSFVNQGNNINVVGRPSKRGRYRG